MTAQEIRVGIIGLGVGEKHIAGFESDPRCRVSTLCDFNPDKLGEVAARNPGRKTTEDWREIVNDPAIDVVSVASYDNAHAEQILAAISASKHVFVEKPLCCYEQEFDQIASALAANPHIRLSSNLILRKFPRFSRLKALIDSGALGALYYMEADYNYGRMEKISDGWRGKLPFYSAVHGGGIHMIDLVLWLTMSRPVEVMAIGSRKASRHTTFQYDDTVVSLLRFDDGTVAKVSVNLPCMYPHFHDVAIFGTTATWRNGMNAAKLYKTRDPDVAPELLDEPYPGSAKGDLIPSFVSSLFDEEESEVSAQEVLDAMAVSLAIERAAKSGQPEQVLYHGLVS